MRAAIYARRSKEQTGVVEETKSVERQVADCRIYALKKGWTVLDEHVYLDDGVSGAEFERRPGFMRMMGALTPRAPITILIVVEQKALGRETYETGYTIKRLAQAGVTVWAQDEDRCLTPKSPLDKMMTSAQGFSDEDHRHRSGTRVKNTHTTKVRLNHVVGGRVFGYTNVDVPGSVDAHGRPKRSHVVREVNEPEARAIRLIFELYASGLGLRGIAKRLQVEDHPAPKPFKRKDGLEPIAHWTPSTIRAILRRDLYRGVVIWNRSQKRTDWGNVNQRPRDKSEWIYVKNEDVRIVSDDLWNAVAARRKDTEGKALRFNDGRLVGRPPKHTAKNLLAGLAKCAVCGGGIVAESSARKRGRAFEYVCSRRRHSKECSNTLRVDLEQMNEAVLQAIEAHALTPEAIERVIQLTEVDDLHDRQVALDREYKDVERRIAHLVEVISNGGDAAPLVAKLRELEARRREIGIERATLQPVPRLPAAVLEDRLSEWRRLLRQSTTQGRAVLQRVLDGRSVFTPREDGQGYDFTAPTRFHRLFAGVVVERPAHIANGARGTEHIGPEETFDGDYGRLLERAYGKCLASPTGVEPVFQP